MSSITDNRQNEGPILGRSFPNRKLTPDQRDALGVALVLGTAHYVPTISESAALTRNTVARLRRALHQHNGTRPRKNGGHKHLSPADLAAAWFQLDEGERIKTLQLMRSGNLSDAPAVEVCDA